MFNIRKGSFVAGESIALKRIIK